MSSLQVKRISELCTFIKDGSHGTHIDYQDGIPLLSAKDIDGGQVRVIGDPRRISPEDYQKLHKNYELQEDDILLTIVGTIGRTAILPKDFPKFTLQRSVAILRPERSAVFPSYLYHFLNSDFFQFQLMMAQNASAQGGIYLGELGKLKINSFSLAEQKYIAEILSSVDKVIEQNKKEIEKIQELKKGMMQDLLVKGIGHTKFKDSPIGKIPENWKIIKLKDTCKLENGRRKPIKSEDRSELKGKYPYYGASGIIDYINDFIFDQERVLLGEDGENILSRNLPLAFIAKGKYWVNNHAHVINVLGNNINYICEYLESLEYGNYSTGSAQPKLTSGTVESLLLKIPPVEEQNKIGEIIETLNANVESQQLKLKKMSDVKKALMQDLLTGKVRVKV